MNKVWLLSCAFGVLIADTVATVAPDETGTVGPEVGNEKEEKHR